jgi:hypothetical protein
MAALHYIALPSCMFLDPYISYIALHSMALHYVALCSITLLCVDLHSIKPLHCITLHYWNAFLPQQIFFSFLLLFFLLLHHHHHNHLLLLLPLLLLLLLLLDLNQQMRWRIPVGIFVCFLLLLLPYRSLSPQATPLQSG